MSTKPLNGSEATALALLAQSPDLPKDERDVVLNSLTGRALKIARVIVGLDDKPKYAVETAKAMRDWAKSLKPNKRKTCPHCGGNL